jgi:pimeloyl-ACP methyl ester carboxylesterase
MTSVQQGALSVPGASIFYRSCGRGRPVLILPGGDADADMASPLAEALADRFRVITFDRRGLSRSPRDPGAAPATIATHADDAHRLLADLTEEPAYVFGSGIGGLIGLALLARRPDQVRLAVAHEPPCAELLPDAERAAMADAQQRIYAAFRRDGPAAALKLSAELVGVDPEDREPDATTPAPSAERAHNSTFPLASDGPQATAHRLDLPALDLLAAKVAPAAGQSTRRTLPHRCAYALAEILERPLVEFPGGHTGWMLRPKAFAAQLAETFARNEPRERPARDAVWART